MISAGLLPCRVCAMRGCSSRAARKSANVAPSTTVTCSRITLPSSKSVRICAGLACGGSSYAPLCMRGLRPCRRRYHSTARALRREPLVSSRASTLRILVPGSTSMRTAADAGPGALNSCSSHSHPPATAAPMRSSRVASSVAMRARPRTAPKLRAAPNPDGSPIGASAARLWRAAHSLELAYRADTHERIGEEQLPGRRHIRGFEAALFCTDTVGSRDLEHQCTHDSGDAALIDERRQEL